MGKDVRKGFERQQRMEQPAVPKVDARRLDLTLLGVRVPRLNLPHHESPREDVEVSSGSCPRDPQRPGERRCVPNLAVVVGDHRPEAPQSLGGDRDPELGDITFEECANEIVAPLGGEGVVGRQERPRKPPAVPQVVITIGADLRQAEPREIDEPDATGQEPGPAAGGAEAPTPAEADSPDDSTAAT